MHRCTHAHIKTYTHTHIHTCLVGPEHVPNANVRNMFGTCFHVIMEYWYLDFWTHGNCKYGDFENLIFQKQEVYTIFENVGFLIFEVLRASLDGFFGWK